MIFYSLLISIPVLHFLIFYIYVNFNSIILSLKEYELSAMDGYVGHFVWFKNFGEAWKASSSKGSSFSGTMW